MKVSFGAPKTTKAPVLQEGDLVVFNGESPAPYLVCSAPIATTRSYFILPLNGAKRNKITSYDSLEELTSALSQSLTFYRHEDIVINLSNVPSHSLREGDEG